MRRPDHSPIIADRAEFIDALRQLLNGHVLVWLSDASWGCRLNGGPLRWSFHILRHFGLIAPFQNRAGFPGVTLHRITDQGRWFGRRVLDLWHSLPL